MTPEDSNAGVTTPAPAAPPAEQETPRAKDGTVEGPKKAAVTVKAGVKAPPAAKEAAAVAAAARGYNTIEIIALGKAPGSAIVQGPDPKKDGPWKVYFT